MRKILITGGAGYIGTTLTPYFLSKGYNVTVFDNLIHKQHAIVANCANPKFKFVCGDVRDQEAYRKQIIDADVIINLAAYVGMPLCKRFPTEAKQVNQDSAEFLAKTVSRDQLIIYGTTNSGYGLGQHVNGKAVFCTEETPLKPISLYGVTKTAAETAIMESGRNISFRLATVMGTSPKMRMDLLLHDFVWRAFNDRFVVLFESQFLRNFVHIKDVASAFSHALNNSDKMAGQLYNLGNTSANVNKMELCLKIKEQVPDFYITESPINKDPDQRNYIVSNEKLEATGWKAEVSLDSAITEILSACPIIKHSSSKFTDV